MAVKKQKLELTWIGKEKTPKLEPRILLEDTSLSYHAKQRYSENDIFDNVLIHGDNLLALRALEADYAGEVKCVFIDPPYNTGSAFEHYDDGIEHSIWLGLMRDRLEILKRLMANEGSIWITIDDNEAHYLKVMCDEIFGRINFVANVIWEKSDSPKMDSRFFSSRHDHVLIYAKNIEKLELNKLAESDGEPQSHYNKIDDAGRRYYTKPLRAMGSGDDTKEARPTLYFPITAPDGTSVFPKRQDGVDGRWRWSKERVESEKDKIDWVKGRGNWSPYYRIYADSQKSRPPETIWFHDDVGSNRTSKLEIKGVFPNENPFTTPKPEKLIERIIHLATNPGELVLDSFGGSGTTGAVAHKMGRKWIMVELGEQCHTHIAPRLKKVISGDEQGGISKTMEWKGGGGFRYYNLAPSMLEKDRWGNWIISKEFNPAMLSEALCKIMGFTYAPSDEHYWIHGHSTETDFIYVTTQTMDQAQLATISQEVGDNCSLLVCCGAFRVKADEFPNLTLKKIPRTVLNKCEWGKDDYSLNVQNLPMAKEEPEEKVTKKSKPATTMPLFEEAGE